MATIKKACKGTSYPKSSSVSKRLGSPSKAKTGTSLGMKSVKAGIDKNPGVTRADIIAAATKQAKKGKIVKKADSGVMQKIEKRKPGSSSPKFEMDMQKFKYQKDMDRMRLEKKKREEDSMRPKGLKVGKTGAKMKKCAYGCK